MASNAESVSIWWRHHVQTMFVLWINERCVLLTSVMHDDIIARNTFRIAGPIGPNAFPSERVSNADHRCFLCCYPEQLVEQTVEISVISNTFQHCRVYKSMDDHQNFKVFRSKLMWIDYYSGGIIQSQILDVGILIYLNGTIVKTATQFYLLTYLAPRHYLSQFLNVVNQSPRNGPRWNCNHRVPFQENMFEDTLYKISPILLQPQYIKACITICIP